MPDQEDANWFDQPFEAAPSLTNSDAEIATQT
jgi:hypothetical protein